MPITVVSMLHIISFNSPITSITIILNFTEEKIEAPFG